MNKKPSRGSDTQSLVPVETISFMNKKPSRGSDTQSLVPVETV